MKKTNTKQKKVFDLFVKAEMVHCCPLCSSSPVPYQVVAHAYGEKSLEFVH